MDKLDILIERIDKEIARHEDISTELALTSKDQEFKKILNTNIKYLKLFKEMAIEVREV